MTLIKNRTSGEAKLPRRGGEFSFNYNNSSADLNVTVCF